MTRQDVMNLNFDQSVSYAGFMNLSFKGKDERHVFLIDNFGNEKPVYIELFMKYGKVNK
jgi:hypothetical protein